MPAPLLRRLHHTGIVTADLDASIALYERLFEASFYERETLEEQGVVVALAALPDGGEIELLSPIRGDTGVARFLAERGPGIHHSAYEVEDLQEALDTLRAAGVELLDETPRIGAGGLHVAFLHPRSTGRTLIELVERQQEGDKRHA